MPGFNVAGLGGGGPNNLGEMKRVYRWQMSFLGRGAGNFPISALLLLKKATRPSWNAEAVTMHHQQEEIYYAGKQKWDAVGIEWYDSEQSPNVSLEVWNWCQSIVNMNTIAVSSPADHKKLATLEMLNGVGSPTERWTMYGCWPKKVAFNDVNYETNQIISVNAEMSYDRANRVL